MIIWFDNKKLKEIKSALMEKNLDFSIMEDDYYSIHGQWLMNVIEKDESNRFEKLSQHIPFMVESTIEKLTYNDESRILFEKMHEFYNEILIDELEFLNSYEESEKKNK